MVRGFFLPVPFETSYSSSRAGVRGCVAGREQGAYLASHGCVGLHRLPFSELIGAKNGVYHLPFSELIGQK